MNSPIVEIDFSNWQQAHSRPEWTAAVEAGKVLHFPRLGFALQPHERALLREDMLAAGKRNVSLGYLKKTIQPANGTQHGASTGTSRRV